MSENKERKTEFAESLSSLTADDICPQKTKKRRGTDLIFDNLRYILIAVCGIILIISGISVASSLKGYADQNKTYDSIGDFVMKADGVEMMFSGPDMPLTPDYKTSQQLTAEDLSDYLNPATVNKEYARVRIKLADLKSQYPDLYGWISVSGTNISYPIMQSEDNDYYLTHSYTGASLGAGAIFADYRCDRTHGSNKNLVLYGHHMSNSSMFHQLDNFLQESFFKNNGKVTIYTLDGMYTYKIFSIYQTTMYYPYITTYFDTDESFLQFAETIEGNSIHKGDDVEFTAGSKLLTLSTCNNRYKSGRLAVHAVMIESYSNPEA